MTLTGTLYQVMMRQSCRGALGAPFASCGEWDTDTVPLRITPVVNAGRSGITIPQIAWGAGLTQRRRAKSAPDLYRMKVPAASTSLRALRNAVFVLAILTFPRP